MKEILKIVGIFFAQLVLGPIAGPVGLAAYVSYWIVVVAAWGIEPVFCIFGGVVSGQTVGIFIGAVLWYGKRHRKVEPMSLDEKLYTLTPGERAMLKSASAKLARKIRT